MKLLCLDVGNTMTKVALFEDDNLLIHDSSEDIDINVLISEHDPDAAIISGSANLEKYKTIDVSHMIVMSQETKLPIAISYETPNTLGIDRLIACIGAIDEYPNENLLIIQMGTCITFNVVTDNQTFVGGSIHPGLDMRYRSMHEYTFALPRQYAHQVDTLQHLPTSTKEAIDTGALRGFVIEIEGMITHYQQLFAGIKVIVSGGSAPYFVKHSNNEIFAHPFINMLGLKKIYEYNS